MQRILYILFLTFVQIFAASAEKGSSKRGLAYGQWVNSSDVHIYNAAKSPLTWYYNFKSTPSKDVDPYAMEFVPMMWGDGKSKTSFYDEVKSQMDGGAIIKYVLGFNEPDICSGGGSCIPAAAAAKAWKKEIEPLKHLGLKLGAPAVTGGNYPWLQEFFTECDGGCTTHFIPLHFYSDVVGVKEWVRNITEIYKNNTVWLTEFACPDCALDVSQIAYNQTVDFLDNEKSVERYSYFGSFRAEYSNTFLGPNVAMLNNGGGLTDIGVWYLDLPANSVNKTSIGPAATKADSRVSSGSGSGSGSGSDSGSKDSGASSLFLSWLQVLPSAALCIVVGYLA